MANGTNGRVYGGDAELVHIPDGQRREAGLAVYRALDDVIRNRAFDAKRKHRGPLCVGCGMIALFNAAVHMADKNGQSRTELARTMANAFAKLADNPDAGLTEEISVILDGDDAQPNGYRPSEVENHNPYHGGFETV